MSRRYLRWYGPAALLLALVLLLGACAQEEPIPTAVPPEPTEVPEELEPEVLWSDVTDQVWVLVGYGDALNPIVVEEGTVITAVFGSEDEQVSGTAGCNNYFTSYTAEDGGELNIDGPIGATMMACEPEIMDQEAAYLGALETVDGYNVSEEGRLELTYDSGESYDQVLVYTPGETPLAGTTWRLVSFGDPDDLWEVEEGTTITAVFEPETEDTGTVGGNATCNSYTTGYTIDGDQISFGPIAATLMMCPVSADQEAAYLAALESTETFQIVGPNMQITYEDGVLNFTSLNLPLENVLWQATTILGEIVPEEVEITALFAPGEDPGEGTVGGNAGCNSYNAAYETDGESLTIEGPMAMTLALCPDEDLAELERTYLAALEEVESYEILGDQMILHTADGDIGFAADREPLVGTYWKLISMGDIDDPQPPVEGSDFAALFSRLPTLPSGTLVGTTGCNDYNATYSSNLAEIKINLPSKTKNEDCPWGKEDFEVEQQFFLGLNSATQYRIVGNILQIPYGEEDAMQVLNFVASPPPVEPGAPLDLTPLDNTFWYLSAIGDEQILPGTEVTAGFEINDDGVTGTMSGSGGCNAYNAAIGANFSVGSIASTRKACQPAVMDQESTYFAWLQSAYSYSRAGDQLLIPTANGVLTFNSRPILDQALDLQNVTWYLISYEQLTPVPGFSPTAFFASDGKSLNGTTGCNDYTGEYKAEQENLLAIGGLGSTKTACASDDLTRQEGGFLALMEAAVRYSVNNTQLQILTSEGGTMNFSSTPPDGPVPPTAVINAPDLGEVGERLTFDGSQSTAGSLPIVRYEWDMDDGSLLSGPRVYYAYGAPGTYKVTLTVVDSAGQTGTATHSMQIAPVVEPVPPTAVIVGPELGETGERLTFDGSQSTPGTAAIDSYNWDMGDGSVLSGSSVRYTYDALGTYEVTLTVTDRHGLSDAATQSVQITPVADLEPPTAVIDAPTVGEVGERLTFDGSGSSASTPSIVRYEWDLGDGSILVGETVSYAYDAPGTYNVSLTVIDQAGLSDTATQSVQITSVEEIEPPTAVIVAPVLAETDEMVAFDGSQSTAGTAAIVRYDWNMGDGSTLRGTAVQHAYDAPGTYNVSLTVTDKAGQSDTATHAIQITAVEEVVGPTAIINGPTLGETGETLTFDGSASTAGTAAIVGYEWDMGDGTILSGATVQHSYDVPGTYSVSLTVTDRGGFSDTATQSTQINAVSEVVPPTAAISGPNMASVGESVMFSAAGSTPGTAAISGYQWQSGDGNDTGQAPDNTFTTIYAQPGTYYPSVMVVDAAGLSDSASMAIVINATLEGNTWALSGTIPGTSITAEFANGTLTGFAGCNTYSASYTTTRAGGNTNSITVGPINITGMLCSEEIMAQEQSYITSLQAATQYTIEGEMLTLTTTAGSPLVFGALKAVPAR